MEMVRDLADPHRAIGKSVIDIAIACFMWAEETPMRAPQAPSKTIKDCCDRVFRGMPEKMDAVIEIEPATHARPPEDPRCQTASLGR